MNMAVDLPTLPLVLTSGQQEAYDAFVRFLLDPYDDVFVLAGYSGTGKTTLVRKIMEDMPKLEKTMRLIEPEFRGWDTVLTATTNKAAEAFSHITKLPVRTIHSVLGLRVHVDYKTRDTKLVAHNGGTIQSGKLIFIDEASYVDHRLLRYIMSLCHHSKVVFMGDPAQLTPVESSDVPVFNKGFKGAHLNQVVRQVEGNPIIDMATGLRNWVETGETCQFRMNGKETRWVDRDNFNLLMKLDFTHPNWRHNDSKFLAWTNKTCIATNHMVNEWVKGTPDFQVGDYAVINRFMPGSTYGLKTDQMVCITDKEPATLFGFLGFDYELDKQRVVFMADDPNARDQAIRNAKGEELYEDLQAIDELWADLRSVYACTINKAQGSTYKRVFLDLDDVGKCRNMDSIARMLYVGVSRASEQVIFTGDLV